KKANITAFSMARLPSSGGSLPPSPASVMTWSRFWRIEMRITAIVDDTIARFQGYFTFSGIRMRQIGRTDRRLAVAAGNVEHVVRLAQAGDTSPQAPHQFLPPGDRRAQMRGSRRKI